MKKTNLQILLSIVLISLCSGCSGQKVQNKKLLPETSTVSESSTSASTKPEPTRPKLDMQKCICVQLWLPVCGENGKTYSNSCFAKCAGVKFKQGSCTKTITD